MKINYSERGILQIDDCRITHKNFSGRKSEYNREGDINFSVVIPDEDVTHLDAYRERGYKILEVPIDFKSKF